MGQLNLAGIALRSVSVAGKFFLLAYLTKYLPLAEVGIYGLFVSTIVLATYVAGFDFYTFSTREIASAAPADRPALLRDQLIFHGLAYLVALPGLGLVFACGFLPWGLLPYFVVVLAGSHLSQEIQRMLIVLEDPGGAYLISAVCHGFWIFPLMAVGVAFPSWRTLHVVLFFWALAAVGAIGLGIVRLRYAGVLGDPGRAIEWQWIRRGMRVSMIFLFGSLAYRLIDLSDRYFIEAFHGPALVGVYTLYASVANIMHDFVFTGVAVMILPRILTGAQRQDTAVWRQHIRVLRRRSIVTSALMLPVFGGGIFVLLRVLNKPGLSANLAAYFLLLLSAIVLNLSLAPHYALYAERRDGSLLFAVGSGAVLNLVLNTLWIPAYSLTGAAAATLASFSVVGVLKAYFARQRDQ